VLFQPLHISCDSAEKGVQFDKSEAKKLCEALLLFSTFLSRVNSHSVMCYVLCVLRVVGGSEDMKQLHEQLAKSKLDCLQLTQALEKKVVAYFHVVL
jgi:hypothetical protein